MSSLFWVYESAPDWLKDLLPILILLAVIAIVVARLPKIDLGHSAAYKQRRFLNWFPLGLTYAFLYMGRYNLSAAKTAIGLTNEEFGLIGGIGTVTYGVAFLLNGPLTDRWGGRTTILIASAGASVANLLMGAALIWGLVPEAEGADRTMVVPVLALLYAMNMYFQSFGAVSIVKVNTAWFHLRERGTFGGIFGILISLGLYFAYDPSRMLLSNYPGQEYLVFFVPALILVVFFGLDWLFVRDNPSDAGMKDIETGDAADDGPRLGVLEVGRRMITNPVIVTVAAIEFCSGFLRNAIMQWYRDFAAQTGIGDTFVPHNWGMLLCASGILGGMFAGLLSDRLFGSRRGPVSAVLYGGLLAGAIVGVFTLTTPAYGWIIIFMSLCVIGVHGMLSAAASMDFAGKRNVGVAVGLIDGMVYAGTGAQFLILGFIMPSGEAAQEMSNWWAWPVAMIPVAMIGLALSTRVWNARPTRGGASAH
jgi:OPA family glycerol-3-phosphate transporter-like MFS transporter